MITNSPSPLWVTEDFWALPLQSTLRYFQRFVCNIRSHFKENLMELQETCTLKITVYIITGVQKLRKLMIPILRNSVWFYFSNLIETRSICNRTFKPSLLIIDSTEAPSTIKNPLNIIINYFGLFFFNLVKNYWIHLNYQINFK